VHVKGLLGFPALDHDYEFSVGVGSVELAPRLLMNQWYRDRQGIKHLLQLPIAGCEGGNDDD
jgi:hypothetical protein